MVPPNLSSDNSGLSALPELVDGSPGAHQRIILGLSMGEQVIQYPGFDMSVD